MRVSPSGMGRMKHLIPLPGRFSFSASTSPDSEIVSDGLAVGAKIRSTRDPAHISAVSPMAGTRAPWLAWGSDDTSNMSISIYPD